MRIDIASEKNEDMPYSCTHLPIKHRSYHFSFDMDLHTAIKFNTKPLCRKVTNHPLKFNGVSEWQYKNQLTIQDKRGTHCLQTSCNNMRHLVLYTWPSVFHTTKKPWLGPQIYIYIYIHVWLQTLQKKIGHLP